MPQHKLSSRLVTGKMLKSLIEEVINGDLPEQAPLPIAEEQSDSEEQAKKVKSVRDIPNAWENDDRSISIDLDDFDFRSEEEIFREQVQFKWVRFYRNLSNREQAVLRSLLGLDVKRYSVDELEKLQGALKGKSLK